MAKVRDGRHGERHGERASYREPEERSMRGSREPWASGSDAAYIKPRLIPDYELLPRDDSGGPEWDPYTQEFGDGGYVTGDKAHLSARGGSDDAELEDEISDEPRSRAAKRAEGEKSVNPKRPAKSARESREED